jgi:hypothetical protein
LTVDTYPYFRCEECARIMEKQAEEANAKLKQEREEENKKNQTFLEGLIGGTITGIFVESERERLLEYLMVEKAGKKYILMGTLYDYDVPAIAVEEKVKE